MIFTVIFPERIHQVPVIPLEGKLAAI